MRNGLKVMIGSNSAYFFQHRKDFDKLLLSGVTPAFVSKVYCMPATPTCLHVINGFFNSE